MTLKRLMIILGILVVLAGAGIMWLWQYAYSPEGRARVIIAQLKNDTTSMRGWMLQHHVVRPGFSEPNRDAYKMTQWAGPELNDLRQAAAANEVGKLGHKALPVVIEALGDDNPDTRRMAVLACGRLHDPLAIEPLAKRLRELAHEPGQIIPLPKMPMPSRSQQENAELQRLCMESLVEIGPKAYGRLMEVSKECVAGLREAIPDALAEKWGAAAAAHLIEMLDDPDETIRDRAAFELGKLKDKLATGALVRHLNEDYIGWTCATALGEIGDAKAAPALLNVLKDKRAESDMRIAAAGGLARMGRDEGFKFLLAMLKSANAENRGTAALELGKTRSKDALGPLLSLLGDRDSYVRSVAAVALGQLRDPSAIPAVRKLLKDSDPSARAAAADSVRILLAAQPPPASPIRASQTSQLGKP